jgi:hypothetical protein
MDNWWNDIERGIQKYSEKDLSKCHFGPIYMSHKLSWDQIGPQCYEAGDQLPEPQSGNYYNFKLEPVVKSRV